MGFTMKERRALARESAQKYRSASKRQKGALLEVFIGQTQYSRRYASWLLRNWGRKVFAWIGGEPIRFVVGVPRSKTPRKRPHPVHRWPDHPGRTQDGVPPVKTARDAHQPSPSAAPRRSFHRPGSFRARVMIAFCGLRNPGSAERIRPGTHRGRASAGMWPGPGRSPACAACRRGCCAPARRPAVPADHHVFPAGQVGEETDVLERSGNPPLHDLVGFTARDVLFDGVYACKFLSRFMELVLRPLLLLMP